MEKKALGRGLEALLPTQPEKRKGQEGETIHLIPVTQIIPNRFQPRQKFEESDLKVLSESIQQNGILQPLLVRRMGDGTFELIAGERRYRAAMLAGIDSVPAIVRNANDNESTVMEDNPPFIGNGDVTANDVDPDFDPLTVTEVNNSPANVGVLQLGTYSSATINAAGLYSYVVNNASHTKEDMEKWMAENQARFDAA